MKFSSLSVAGWRQFADINIEMHPRMTIITGANGAGKTTLLRLLSQHFGWNYSLLATPKKQNGSANFSYASGFFKRIKGAEYQQPHNVHQIGFITYDNGLRAVLAVPDITSAAYLVEIRGQQSILGLHINSHRPLQNYQPIAAIPTSSIGAEQAYNTYWNELVQRYNNGYAQFSPLYRMKETLISMAMFGAGNQYVQKNEALEKLFLEFKRILAEVLPPSIGFIDISVRIPDVVLVTRTGEFMIDAASGGLMSIIDLAWQIFLYSHNKSEFVVLLDEPENHLHPSMQRSLLGRFVNAFPQAQFIVATHSPFIVSSIKDSAVYALKYNNPEATDSAVATISSVELNLDNRAATANEILRDVLGVPVTLPQWAEDDLMTIAGNLTIDDITPVGLSRLKENLTAAGLGEYYPDALKLVANKKQ